MKKLIVLVVLSAFSVVPAIAQQSWFEFEISKKIGKKFELALAPEIRFAEDFILDKYFIEPKLEYQFNKYLELGASYRLGNNLTKKGNDQWFGRFGVEAKTAYEWKNLEAQLRLRYTNSDDFEDLDQTNYIRAKFGLEYAVKKLDLKPYAAYELYRSLDLGTFDKARWETGLEYKISKHHRVGAYFRLNDYLNSDDESVKIIGVSYKLKL